MPSAAKSAAGVPAAKPSPKPASPAAVQPAGKPPAKGKPAASPPGKTTAKSTAKPAAKPAGDPATKQAAAGAAKAATQPQARPASGASGASAATDPTPPGAAPAADPPAPAAAASAGPAPRTALAHATVTEPAGLDRGREPLTFGVPFARGALADAAALRGWTEAGVPLPVQARTLNRWPDGSARWVLVDSQVALAAHEAARIVLGLAPDIAAAPVPWITVTDPAGRKDKSAGVMPMMTDGTTVWEILHLDPGAAGDGDAVLGFAPLLTDRFGKGYVGAVDLASVQVLEAGPLRLCVQLTGRHRAAVKTPELPSFHTFSVVVSLLAGCKTARVEWTLRNGPLQNPTGPLAFRSYELAGDVGGAVAGRAAAAPPDEASPPAGPCGIDVPGHTEDSDPGFSLQQDGASPDLFRYAGGGASLPAADSDLWAGVSCGKTGLWVHRLDSAHNHPAALSHEAGGPLRLGLLPPVNGLEYWLDDATQKTFRFDVVRDAGELGRDLAERASQPAHVAVDFADMAASGAWGDTGTAYVPDAVALREPVELPKDPATGWADWGEFITRSTHESGSPRSRLSVYLEALQTGRRDLYALARARAFHAMDLRPFHITGFRAADFPAANLHEGTPHPNEPPKNRLGRSEMDARLPAWKTGLPPRGHGYNGFDPEHMTLDDIYECWLLTGDWVALDALQSAGEAMLTWRSVMPGGELHTARSTGWTLRALVQVFRATGERRYLEAAADMVARADKERGKGEVKYLHRNKKDPRHIADKESESPWMVAVAIQGLCAYHAASHDPKVPGMLRDLVDFIMASFRGNGFVDDQPVDGPLTGGKVASPLGVSQWIPGALAEAAFVTGNHKPVDVVYPYFRRMVEHEGHALRFGAPAWHWWQAYLASLEQRHGVRSVRDPTHYDMPAPGSR